MLRLPLRVTATHHPLERIAQFTVRHGHRAEPEAFVKSLLIPGQADLLLPPYWQQCNLCSPGFSPTVVLKHEFLNLDLIHLVSEVLRFNSSLRDLPDNFYQVQPVEISSGAAAVFSRLSKSLIRDLFERYRADHALFGYDPEPYIELGTDI